MNSATDVWGRVLNILSSDLTETAISTWFDDCRAIELSDSRLFIHTPSVFKKSVIEGRFIGTIKSALCEIFSGEYDVIILDDDGLKAMTEASSEPDYMYIDEYTFENFVVGNSNKFAHAAALAVGEGLPKQGYNPLFIYGESGLGKTHLLHAIRHSISKKYPHYRIACVKGDEFLNELILAIQQGKMIEFREKYRGADFFLMDDIQFIAGKIETQNEFFNTFNTLYELGKQIVFTSDRPPSEMHRLEDRLKTRLESSLQADIQPPDDALRVAIIRNKAEQLGVTFPDDVTNYIAENLISNVRQLEGAVKMIIAYRDIMDDDITVASVTSRLKDMFKGIKELIPTTETIISETAKYYLLTPENLKGQSRTRDTALARQIAMFLIRKMTNLSLKDIGEIFDGRDHSTVLSSIRRIEATLREKTEFSKIISDITSNINSIT
ncbi:MAG: chromosomal replication initiator protein DnaA [Oscillospiraceae bacterium]|nr:chromosomal replication initiator protein DnaA [Oscillospiraceae bacterium]